MQAMADQLHRIEPLGVNCELGFALHALGNRDRALLRWSFTPPKSVAPLIDADFASIYEPQSLVPIGLNMVKDTRYNIDYHTNVKTERRDGLWCFVDDDAARRERILVAERTLISNYVAKFRGRFNEPHTLYVITRHPSGSPKVTQAILTAIEARSGDTPFSLLEVRASAGEEPVGEVEKVGEHFYTGCVGFFSPPHRANEIDVEGWTRLLGRALEMTLAE